MTSVEFFDAKTGEWLSLPSLNRGRRSHVMTVTKGRLLVAGGGAGYAAKSCDEIGRVAAVLGVRGVWGARDAWVA